MAVTYVGGDSASATSSVSNRVLTIPTVEDGDIGLLVYGHGTSQASPPAGWTLLNAAVSGTMYGEVFWRDLHAEDSGSTITVTVGTAQRQTGTLAIYRGAGAVSAASSSATATSHPAPSHPAPAGGAHSVTILFERGTTHSTAFTPPGAHTMRLATYGDGSGACSSAVADQLGTLVAEGNPVTTGAWTADISAATIVWAIAITPAVASPLSGTLTLTPASGHAPLTVTATATVTGGTGTPKEYNFEWGDGTNSGWQANDILTHTYTTPGEYTAAGGDPVRCHVRNT